MLLSCLLEPEGMPENRVPAGRTEPSFKGDAWFLFKTGNCGRWASVGVGYINNVSKRLDLLDCFLSKEESRTRGGSGGKALQWVPDVSDIFAQQKLPLPAVAMWLFRGAITEAGDVLEMKGVLRTSLSQLKDTYILPTSHDNWANSTKLCELNLFLCCH